MSTIGRRVSECLERIDRCMDHCGLSPINNLVNCIIKTCMRIYSKCYPDLDLREKRKQAFLGHYFNYIDKKDGEMCVVGLVPLLGSVLIYDYNKTCENKKKFHKDIVLELPQVALGTSAEEEGNISDLDLEDDDSDSEKPTYQNRSPFSDGHVKEVTDKAQKDDEEEFAVLNLRVAHSFDLGLDEGLELSERFTEL
jgi:hypothetical protein